MEKIGSLIKEINIKYVSYYRFSNRISINDITKVIDVVKGSGVEINKLRLSNSQEGPDHFFRVFSNLSEFNAFVWDDKYIDDFGLTGTYEGVKFDLTFDYVANKIITITKGNIDLEPMLIQMEQYCQKTR